jgi:hypothetical protein
MMVFQLLQFVVTQVGKRPEVIAGLKVRKVPMRNQIMDAVTDMNCRALITQAMAQEEELVKLPTVLISLFDSQLEPVRIWSEEIAQFLEPLFARFLNRRLAKFRTHMMDVFHKQMSFEFNQTYENSFQIHD